MSRLFFSLVLSWIVIFSPFVASAQDARNWAKDIFVKIQPTKQVGAVAEVVFHNNLFHISDETFVLTYENITIEVYFEFNVSGNLGADDRLTVVPPQGYIAIPETIDVPEGGKDIIYIYRSDLS